MNVRSSEQVPPIGTTGLSAKLMDSLSLDMADSVEKVALPPR
jgi:hypothetical protein